MDLLTSEELRLFLEKANRVAGPKIISLMAKLYKDLAFILTNELGKQILNDDLDRIEELFEKVYKEKATKWEAVEFRFLRDFKIPMTIKKIRDYLKYIEYVKKTVQK